MVKRALGVLAGLIVAFVLISAVQFGSHMLHPPPDSLDMSDPEALAEWADTLPLSALLLVLLSYALGAFGGGFTAARLSGDPAWPALIVGGILLCLGFLNLANLPHPLWFAAASTLIYIPAALVGARLARQVAD